MRKRFQYKENTPQRVMAEFLHAWSEKEYGLMLTHTHPFWRKFYDEPLLQIESMFREHDMDGAVIQDIIDKKSNNVVKIKTKIFMIDQHGQKLSKRVFWMCAREIDDPKKNYPLDSKGTWGINPLSGLISLTEANKGKAVDEFKNIVDKMKDKGSTETIL